MGSDHLTVVVGTALGGFLPETAEAIDPLNLPWPTTHQHTPLPVISKQSPQSLMISALARSIWTRTAAGAVPPSESRAATDRRKSKTS